MGVNHTLRQRLCSQGIKVGSSKRKVGLKNSAESVCDYLFASCPGIGTYVTESKLLMNSRLSAPTSRQSAATGRVIWISVFCSFLTSVATHFVFAHFSPSKPSAVAPPLLPAVENPTARAAPADNPSDDSLSIGNQQADTSKSGDDVLRTASAGASGVLDVIKLAGDPSNGYIVGGRHAQLAQELQVLGMAASRLRQDNGQDPDQTRKSIALFSSALGVAISRLDIIYGRPNEDEVSNQVTLMLKTKLTEVKNSLPQP
jgi:hypothetical protein